MMTGLGGSTLISHMKQIVRTRSGVDLSVYRSKICPGGVESAAATGQTQMSAVAAATTSAAAARLVVRMRFETTALPGRRAVEARHVGPADGAPADLTWGHFGRSTQRPPYCSLSLTSLACFKKNDPPVMQSAVLCFVFVGGAPAVVWRSPQRSFDLRLTLREGCAQVVIIPSP